jgi:hypothetical protein
LFASFGKNYIASSAVIGLSVMRELLPFSHQYRDAGIQRQYRELVSTKRRIGQPGFSGGRYGNTGNRPIVPRFGEQIFFVFDRKEGRDFRVKCRYKYGVPQRIALPALCAVSTALAIAP